MSYEDPLLGPAGRLVVAGQVEAASGPQSSARRFEEARGRVVAMLHETSLALEALPAATCPNDEAVASFWTRSEAVTRATHRSAGHGLRVSDRAATFPWTSEVHFELERLPPMACARDTHAAARELPPLGSSQRTRKRSWLRWRDRARPRAPTPTSALRLLASRWRLRPARARRCPVLAPSLACCSLSSANARTAPRAGGSRLGAGAHCEGEM